MVLHREMILLREMVLLRWMALLRGIVLLREIVLDRGIVLLHGMVLDRIVLRCVMVRLQSAAPPRDESVLIAGSRQICRQI